MNKLILALSVFALLLGSTNAGWGSYQEIANLSKNWSATQQGGGWQYQYFKGNGTRINMTQDCSGTSGSNYQCWKSGETDQTSTSLFPLTYNLSMQVGTGGGESFPNLAYVYYFTSFGNYTLNGSAWGYSGIGNGDGINYTLYLNGVLVCSGPLAINRSQHNFVCDIGKEVVAGSYVEFDIGANSGSGFDYGNFTATVYGVLGEGNINTVTIVSPENNSNNPAIKQTFVFNPSLENDIINASIWYNRTGWTKLADNTSIVVNASLNNLDATFPASGLYTVAVQVCNILDECYFSKNQTLNLTAFIGTVLNTPANNSANTTLLVPFGFTPNSTFSIKNATVYANATGWTALASSSSISNATLNWINTTIPRTGVFIVSIEVCDVNNYCNRSLNTTINLTVARLRIQVLNETTTPTNILFNITISNGTNTTVYPTMTGIWFNKTRNEIPLGDLQITLDNTTFLFRERDYYLQFNYSNTILTAYLLVESLDSEIDLTLKDYAGNLKTGYYLVAQRSFFGTDNYTTVAESRTDYSGIGVMHLLASATYRFAAYDENYNFVQAWEPVLISTLVLIATNTYSKTFIIGQQSFPIYGAGYSITASCSFDNSTSTMSCTVSDLDDANIGSTLSVGNLTSAGWIQVCSDSITTPDGTLSCHADGLNQTYFKYLLEVYYPDGSVYIADSGSFDYGGIVFNWGNDGFILFAALIIIVAAVFSWDFNVMIIAVGIASAAAKMLNVLNVGWESVIGIWCILAVILYINRNKG